MAILEYNPPTDPWLDIIYQDEDIIVINKPAWLLSVPGKHPEHADSVYNRVREIHPECQIVHRLDMATSGIIVLALHKQAERHIKIQFQDRVTQKLYYARVWGNIEKETGKVDLPLICDWPNRPKQMVCFERGKPSLTQYEVIAREENSVFTSGRAKTTLVKLLPHTGRSHQLRVHMLSLEHPIIGDRLYAHPDALALSPETLQLHAAEIRLKHPRTEEWVHFYAPCDFYPDSPDNLLAL